MAEVPDMFNLDREPGHPSVFITGAFIVDDQRNRAIVLDTPEQIEWYRCLVLKHYCQLRASKNPLIKRSRTLKSINREFGWQCRTFADAADMLAIRTGTPRQSERRSSGLNTTS